LVEIPDDGLTVAEIRFAYRDVLNVSPSACAYVGGNVIEDDCVPTPMARVVFLRDWGRKGADRPNVIVVELGPTTLAMLDRIAGRAEEFGKRQLSAPALADDRVVVERLASAAEEIAHHLDPKPPEIVKSSYVARRFGCTIKWVGEMVRRGEVPKSCIAPGSGNGKQWRFYRSLIDKWVESKT
jgi:hypothetical protein